MREIIIYEGNYTKEIIVTSICNHEGDYYLRAKYVVQPVNGICNLVLVRGTSLL